MRTGYTGGVRISWLDPAVVRKVRAVFTAMNADWAVYFLPEFQAPRTPAGFEHEHWLRVAEHVARAERVSQAVREGGLDAALARFRGSGHAIEQATLVAAAVQVDQVEFELVVELLECEIDDLVVYGSILDLLPRFRTGHGSKALAVYEQFCAAFAAKTSDHDFWLDRVRAVRDGLAGFYIVSGRHEDGHRVFLERHEEEPTSMLAALAASRSFWAAGAVSLAIGWLELAARRAESLGRPELADSLRKKQKVLRARQS